MIADYFNYAVPMKERWTAVSLFAGVGGFDLALERNGVDVVASAEIDKHARAILAKQFPNQKQFDDVRKVNANELRDAGFIPERGIITGGFPCQDLSVAGKRAGLAGARSGLFYEIARIADETKAKWLVLENVPGLLSSQRGADMGAVVGTLVDLGYGVAWRVLDAQHFGVPQRRRRVFIVAERAGDPTGPAEVLFKRQSLRGDSSQSGTSREEVAGDVGSSAEKPMLLTQREGKPGGGKGPLISVDQSLTLATQNSQVLYEPVGTIAASGFRCDLNKAQNGHLTIEPTLYEPHHGDGRATDLVTESTLANGKEIIGTIPASLYHHGTLVNQDVDSGMMVIESSVEPVMERTITHEVIGTLQSRMHKGVNHEGARDGHLIIETSVEPQVFVKAKRAQNDQDDETWKTDAPHPTLNQFDQGDSRTVTAVVEFENELPALLTMHEGVTGQGGRGPLIKYDQSLTLTTGNGQVLFNQEEIKLAVRRLTPLECERLQGFPDGWTEGQADSHRYKQMGNAVAVPVVEWVIQGIMEAGL